MAKGGIRSYGPGKFHTIIDSHAYSVTMDGVDREAGDVNETGWYGFIEVDDQTRDVIRKIADDEEDDLTEEEEEMLEESVAIIFFERTDGIVEATWFEDAEEADEEWEAIEEDVGGGEESDD